MDDMTRIAKAADITLEKHGGVALVRSADALAFLHAATAAGVRILGIDGLVLEGGELYADEAAECDLTDLDELDAVAAEAEDFLSGFGAADDLYWDFLLDEE